MTSRVKDKDAEMTFFQHLDELRGRIIKSFLAIFICAIPAIYFVDDIINKILLRPIENVNVPLQVLTPYGIVVLYMEVILITSLIISMPIILLQIWKFVAPGLKQNERKYIWWIVFFTTLCFFSGIVFSYYIILPTSLQFFAGFGTEKIKLNIALDKYISFVMTMVFVCGLLFELPMVSYFLSKLGIITPAFLRHYRRHSIVTIFVISAFVTPSPDALTQSLLAAPIIILYEVSILISAFVHRNNEKLKI
ncbi:MAG: twin-arginine translocase subunit TatC [Bacteroidetes bacterium]|nr:twin-arginine translocase subunit TatC [Bacteroidota bacterium]